MILRPGTPVKAAKYKITGTWIFAPKIVKIGDSERYEAVYRGQTIVGSTPDEVRTALLRFMFPGGDEGLISVQVNRLD